MLSYQHIYHAGNFADVHKHAVLSLLIGHLAKKETPFFILDAHGGRGLYPLAASEAQKTQEYETGIGRIWPLQDSAPAVLAPYFRAIADANPGRELTHYPGSPLLALCLMRPQDKIAVVEKHPGEITHLRHCLKNFSQAAIHERDAYEALSGLLPPAQKRGLVLIDPSYEDKNEYAGLPQKLAAALKKWPQGIFAVWYPVLPAAHHEKLLEGMSALTGREIIDTRLSLDQSPMAMTGSGMIVVNPPWKLDEEMTQACGWLAENLGGSHRLTRYGT